MAIHRKLTIRGRVQGVFFRRSAYEKAASLGVAGFVRNEPDGAVYIEAEGSEYTLEQFILWAWQGPPGAHVEYVKVEKGDLVPHEGFQIR